MPHQGKSCVTSPAPTSPKSSIRRLQCPHVLGTPSANAVGQRGNAPFPLGPDLSAPKSSPATIRFPRSTTTLLSIPWSDRSPRPIQSRAHRRRQELYANARTKDGPRVKTSPEDLRRQFDLDRKIAEALHKDYEALKQVRSLRAQIRWLLRDQHSTSMASSTGLDAAAKIAAELDAKAALIEGEEGGATYLSTPAGRSLSRLNGASTPSSALSIPPTPRPQPSSPRPSRNWRKPSKRGYRCGSNSTQKKFPR